MGFIVTSAASLGALALLAGCDTKSLADPSEVGRYKKGEALVVPILNTVDAGVEEANDQFANAADPTPADLAGASGDYRVSRDDQLTVSISDLQGPGVETSKTVRVNESGYISLPYLGAFKAEGMSEIELEQSIAEAYRQKGLIANAQVSVAVVDPRGRAFSILGAVAKPGEYPILQGDFRVLNALVDAGDTTTPNVEYAYVIRKVEPARKGSAAPSAPATVPATGPTSDELAPKPHSDASDPSSQHVVQLAQATERSANPLIDLAETPAANTPATAPAVAAVESATAGGAFTGFNQPNPDDSRVIRVPIQALRNGDLRYNIRVIPHDVIVVQNLAFGNYFMGGHVTRPGAYTLTGQKLTLKQAVIAAGMLDALAIPQRTDIIRRLKPNHEVYVRIDLDKIFSGQQPDLYLKPDDQIMVGTNALAPFLSAARGAFRLTYGAGFIYDRNFAVNSRTGAAQ